MAAPDAGTTVISVCTLQHVAVWSHTSRLLPRFVEADDYVVYVPDNQVDVFRSVTNSVVRVEPENELGATFRAELIESLDKVHNLGRFGWYYQQFLKIQALLEANGDRGIIWDADAVPLRHQELFDSNGYPVYAKASEYHAPYFMAIERLLDIKRVQEQSFIVPGFPLPRLWLDEWVSDTERRHSGKSWHACLLDSIDFSLKAGFSEFETLGTWVSHRHPDEFHRIDSKWLRTGQSSLGYAKDFDLEHLLDYGRKHDLDVVSFESWDLPGLKGRIRNLRLAMDSRLRKAGLLLQYADRSHGSGQLA